MSDKTAAAPRRVAKPRAREQARRPSEHVRRKQESRRRDILDAAAEVFAERGYFNASMKNIAERLGMRPGSLYHYFPSKEAALEEMCRVSAIEFCDKLRAILAENGSAVAMVRAGMLAHLTSERRAHVEIFAFSRRNLPAGVVEDLNNLARAYRQIWRRIFVHGTERGEWRRDLDPDIAADAVLALCNSAAGTLSRRKSVDPREAASLWVDIFLEGAQRR